MWRLGIETVYLGCMIGVHLCMYIEGDIDSASHTCTYRVKDKKQRIIVSVS